MSRRRIWWNKGHESIESLRADGIFNSSDVDELENVKVESQVNVQKARDDSSGPHMQYTGFFRAPVSGNYSFLISSNYVARLWVGTPETLELLIDFKSWVHSRAWDRELWVRGRYTNPLSTLNIAKSQRATRKVELQEGDFLYLDAHYRSGGGNDNFALAVVQHNRCKSYVHVHFFVRTRTHTRHACIFFKSFGLYIFNIFTSTVPLIVRMCLQLSMRSN